MSAPARISIVVPVLNEAAALPALLQALQPLRAQGHELITADGGSDDASPAVARPWADHWLQAPRGRARQMNAGAAQARGDWLLFLHADTQLPPEAATLLQQAWQQGAAWGRFDVQISGQAAMLRVVAALMNLRSRLTGVATGDQALFVRRSLFQQLGGYAEQPLMEDIELSRRLKRLARPACLRARVQTSGRRWEARGVWRTIFLMWRLRWRYWRGESPDSLARAYR
jgi:rSAM/selenodomain-associated transferase 2